MGTIIVHNLYGYVSTHRVSLFKLFELGCERALIYGLGLKMVGQNCLFFIENKIAKSILWFHFYLSYHFYQVVPLLT